MADQHVARPAPRPRRKALIWSPGIVVCIATLVLQIAPQQRVRTPGSRLFNFGAPSVYVAAHALPGDGVLFFGPFFRKARLGYPADYRDLRDFGMAESPVAAGTFQGTDQPAWRGGLAPAGRITASGSSATPRQPAWPPRRCGRRAVALLDHFTLVTRRQWKGISLTLWVRR